MSAITMVNLLNTIRDNASEDYANRVPVATQNNLTAVGAPILTYALTQNEFLSMLINKIALTIIHNKTLTNALASLKKGAIPLGKDIEEIYINPATAEVFDGTATANVMTQKKADVKTLYHRLNRQDVYTVTVSDAQLQTAFTSFSKLEELIGGIVNTLYSGDNYDEFILMKHLMEDAIVDGKIVTLETTPVTDEASAKDFIKAVNTCSKMMTFPSSNFNVYFANKPVGDTGKAVITWTPIEDQVLVIRADVMAQIDVEVLAVAFNMDKADIQARILVLDTFGEDPLVNDVYAILCDRSWIQVYDNLTRMTEFYNGKGLYWNYFYHHWQTYSFSLFANAVAFKKTVV